MLALFGTSELRPSFGLPVAKVGNASLHQLQVHFHKVILDAARFRCCKDFLPVEGALANRRYLPGFCGPTLDVHRSEAAWVLVEVLGGVVATVNGGDLELELDQLRIEKVEQ